MKHSVKFTTNLVKKFTDESSAEVHVFVSQAERLQCTCKEYSKTEWCKHIQHVLVNHDDSMTIEPDSAILVPIFGSKIKLEVAAFIGEERANMKLAGLMHPEPDAEGWMLGYLAEGEGRMALRTMVIELLYANYRRVPSCKSKWHAIDAFSQTDKRMSDANRPEILASVYSLMTSKYCHDCATDPTGVPDVGANWR